MDILVQNSTKKIFSKRNVENSFLISFFCDSKRKCEPDAEQQTAYKSEKIKASKISVKKLLKKKN